MVDMSVSPPRSPSGSDYSDEGYPLGSDWSPAVSSVISTDCSPHNIQLNEQDISVMSSDVKASEPDHYNGTLDLAALLYNDNDPGFAFIKVNKIQQHSTRSIRDDNVYLVGDTGVSIGNLLQHKKSSYAYGPYKTKGEYVLAMYRTMFPQSVEAYDNLARLIREGIIMPSDFKCHRTFVTRTKSLPLLRQYVYVCPDGHHIAFHALGDVIGRIVQYRRSVFPHIPLDDLFKCPSRPLVVRELMHGRQARSSPLLTRDFIHLVDGTELHLGDLLVIKKDGVLQGSSGDSMDFNNNLVQLSSIYQLTHDDPNPLKYGCSITPYRRCVIGDDPGFMISAALRADRQEVRKYCGNLGPFMDTLTCRKAERVLDDTEFFIDTIDLFCLLASVPVNVRLYTLVAYIELPSSQREGAVWCDSFLMRSMSHRSCDVFDGIHQSDRGCNNSDIQLPIYMKIPHPTELFTFDATLLRQVEEQGIAVLRLGLLIYYDDFSVYNKIYHSTGGCYIQITNLDKRLRNALDNWWLLLFASPGCEVCHIFKTLLPQLKELQKGKLFHLGQDENVFVFVSVHLVLADTPQAHDMCGHKRHTMKTHHPCMRCAQHQDVLVDLFEQKVDLEKVLTENNRTPLMTRRNRDILDDMLEQDLSVDDIGEQLKKTGLKEDSSPFEWTDDSGLLFNQHVQIPPEALHVMLLGLIDYVIDSTDDMLTLGGHLALNEHIHCNIKKYTPPHWDPMGPLFRMKSESKSSSGAKNKSIYTGSEKYRLIQVAPLLLHDFFEKLPVAKWSNSEACILVREGGELETRDKTEWGRYVYKAWVLIARIINISLAKSRLNIRIDAVRRTNIVRGLLREFLEIFISHKTKPKIHALLHCAAVEDWLGLFRLCDASRGETYHKTSRMAARHLNHKHIELDLMRVNNIQHTLQFLSSVVPMFYAGTTVGRNIRELMDKPVVKRLLKDRRNFELQLLCENAEPDDRDPTYEFGEGDLAFVVGTVDRFGKQKIECDRITEWLNDDNDRDVKLYGGCNNGSDHEDEVQVVRLGYHNDQMPFDGATLMETHLTDTDKEELCSIYGGGCIIPDSYAIRVGWAFPRSMRDDAMFVQEEMFFKLKRGGVCRVDHILVHRVSVHTSHALYEFRCTLRVLMCEEFKLAGRTPVAISGCKRYRMRSPPEFVDINQLASFAHMVYATDLPFPYYNRFYIG
jgi:hypothetical protein